MRSAETELDSVYENGFISRIEDRLGDRPDYEKFDEFKSFLREGSLLEIGPGTGHYLAAARKAGYSVSGIELSTHNRKYIRDKWQLEMAAEPLEANAFPAESVDNVVSFNCIEHIVDPGLHLASAFRVLKPGGRLFVSTCNAGALVAKVAGPYWSMFKVPDHFSIPSAKSLRLAGTRSGFSKAAVTFSEYPLETPLGVLLAVHDWVLDTDPKYFGWRPKKHLLPVPAASDGKPQADPKPARSRFRNLVHAKPFGWVSGLMSYFESTGCIRVLYEKPF